MQQKDSQQSIWRKVRCVL